MKSWQIDEFGHVIIGEITDDGGYLIKILPSDDEDMFVLYEIKEFDDVKTNLIDTFYGKRGLHVAIARGRTFL